MPNSEPLEYFTLQQCSTLFLPLFSTAAATVGFCIGYAWRDFQAYEESNKQKAEADKRVMAERERVNRHWDYTLGATVTSVSQSRQPYFLRICKIALILAGT